MHSTGQFDSFLLRLCPQPWDEQCSMIICGFRLENAAAGIAGWPEASALFSDTIDAERYFRGVM